MIIYFALLIPVIAILYALIFQRKKVIWWEALLTVVIPILFVAVIKYLEGQKLEEFNYLTVPVPTVATVLSFMLSFVLSGGLLAWSVKNEYEAVE